MDRCYLLVEGQTEETFANRMLVPHLYSMGFQSVVPVVVATKRVAVGGKMRGGISSWPKLRDEIGLMVRDSGSLVTTLVDFYGLPKDAPGINGLQAAWTPQQRVAHVEAALKAEVGSGNFLPHVVLHEFEALLYADPSVVAAHFGDDDIATAMHEDLAACGGPEFVNEGPDTAPSKRLMKHRPGYAKTTDGPAILADIGLPAIRNECPHFDAWLAAVESHAPR